MQTFLPFPDFAETARALDRQRLGKQRVETLQIVRALTTGKGWTRHPATRMWDGRLSALLAYQRAVCHEWVAVRGYRDTCLEKTLAAADYLPSGPYALPSWLGDPAFHRSHQSNLLRKLPDHYGPLFPGVPDDLPYVWPVAA